jgi:hypothetical protein
MPPPLEEPGVGWWQRATSAVDAASHVAAASSDPALLLSRRSLPQQNVGGWHCVQRRGSTKRPRCVQNPSAVSAASEHRSGPYMDEAACNINCHWYRCDESAGKDNPQCRRTDNNAEPGTRFLGWDTCLHQCALRDPLTRSEPLLYDHPREDEDAIITLGNLLTTRENHADPQRAEDNTASQLRHQTPQAFVARLQRTVQQKALNADEARLELMAARAAVSHLRSTSGDFARVTGRAVRADPGMTRAADGIQTQLAAIEAMLTHVLSEPPVLHIQPPVDARIYLGPTSEYHVASNPWFQAANAAFIRRRFQRTQAAFLAAVLGMPPGVDAAEWYTRNSSTQLAADFYAWLQREWPRVAARIDLKTQAGQIFDLVTGLVPQVW